MHPTAVLICLFIASTTGVNSSFGDSQWKSPFDTCPAILAPLSLTNLQVQNVLNCTLNMTYENVLQQVNLAEQLISSDFGVSTGIIYLRILGKQQMVLMYYCKRRTWQYCG